jgi:predicted membrane protein
MQWKDKNKYRLAYVAVYMLMIFADLIFADLSRYRHSLSMLSFETLNLFFSLMLAQRIFDVSFKKQHKKILLMILIPNTLTQIILVKNVAFFYFHYEPGWAINFGIISYLLNAVNTVSYIFFSIALLWIPKKEVFLQRIS